MSLATCLLLAVVCSCSSKENVRKTVESDDVDEVENNDEGDAQYTYLSQDLATFDLYGQVLSVCYTQAGQPKTVIQFGPDGDAVAMMHSYTADDIESANLMYNDKQQIEEIQWGDDPWVTTFEYEKSSMAPSGYTNTNRIGNWTSYTLMRDGNGQLAELIRKEAVHDEIIDTQHPRFTFSQFDDHGNWLLYTEEQDDNWTFTIQREIVYHDGSAQQ